MKTLTIRVDAVDTAFDIPGMKYDWHCPQWRGRRHWRVFPTETAALDTRAECALRDLLDHGLTEIRIVTMDPPRPSEPAQGDNAPCVKRACELYEAVLTKLSNPPEGTADYRVCLHDVRNARGEFIYPKRLWAWPYGSVSIGRSQDKLTMAQNLPRLNIADALTCAWPTPRKIELKDFEKLEKRVASLEFSARQRAFKEAVLAPYGAKKSPSYFLQTVDFHRFSDHGANLLNRTVEPKKPDCSKMVLRIHPGGVAGLCLPETAPLHGMNKTKGKGAEGGVYSIAPHRHEAESLAKKLKELKVRELTLRRYGGATMEHMTEWLTAIVNASSPVMKIISDPEPLK